MQTYASYFFVAISELIRFPYAETARTLMLSSDNFIEVVVQELDGRRFLGWGGDWVITRAAARPFKGFVEAISFCIPRHIRLVRLVGRRESGGHEVYCYPFGHDPVAKAERRKLRRALRENRRLKRERRVILGGLDSLLAGGKEKKKQFPFQRKSIGEG